MKKSLSLFLVLLVLLLSSCNKIDDYLLGKDNTPTPKELHSIDASVSVKKEWAVSIGGSQSNGSYLNLKPVLSGSTIYVASFGGQFAALNKNTGKIVWSNKTRYKFVSGPVLGEGMLVLSTNNAELVAFNPRDGHEIWRHNVSSEVLGRPIITRGQVIVKTVDGHLYSFDSRQGKTLWHLEHGSPSLALNASSSPVLLNNQTILVGYADGKLDAVDSDNGHLIWQRGIIYATGSSDVERLVDIDADPIVSGNHVVLASYQGSIGKLSLVDGQFDWRRPASVYKNMTFKNGSLYFVDSNDVLWALNEKTGQVIWKQPALKSRNVTEPAVEDNHLFVADKTGLLHVLDRDTGAFLAREPLKEAVYVAPLVSGHRVYLLTASNQLACYKIH